MFEKVKGFVQKHKAKVMVAVGSAVAAMGAVSPVAFASSPGDVIGDVVDTTTMWSKLTGGASSFINGFLLPIASFCTSNGICLMFLSATFIKLAVGVLRRSIGAFGRGR